MQQEQINNLLIQFATWNILNSLVQFQQIVKIWLIPNKILCNILIYILLTRLSRTHTNILTDNINFLTIANKINNTPTHQLSEIYRLNNWPA